MYIELVDSEIDLGYCASCIPLYGMFSCVIGIKFMCMNNRSMSLVIKLIVKGLEQVIERGKSEEE